MRKQYQPYVQLVIMLIVLLLPMLSMAQQLFTDQPPNGSPFNSSSVDPDIAPIDGGLSLLVAAGVGYGAKKMKEKRKPLTPKGE